MICHKENIGGIYGHRRPKGAEKNFFGGRPKGDFIFFGEYFLDAHGLDDPANLSFFKS